ncbi:MULTISPECIES: GNAT family N-acetyltransferase [Flavobacterium]|jgi:predicted GNAT family acetyltransferase|uniref:GNAT family N-acetyltransferase n=1 Tax=Flavobacterium TaxID=237 RepID=UPI0022AC6FCB|nr:MULTISPECIES: GNAT family N-acetyltransferase [Flavobacterium]
MSDTVTIEFNDKNGSFNITNEGRKVALMTFVFAGPNKIIIDHTEVSPVFNGKGLGKKLIEKAVEVARQKKWTIIPLCPFAKKTFEKNPEYNDVL